jgi:carboxylesterase
MRFALSSAIALLVASACTPIEWEEGWLDHPDTRHPAVLQPQDYLLSARYPDGVAVDLDRPVIVMAHGFGSSPTTMSDLREYAESRHILVSNVTLGGHGISTDAWVETDEYDWGAPLLREYRALVDRGFTDISIVAESTAIPLWLRHFIDGSMDELPAPRRFAVLSPFIISLDKRLYIAPIIGPILNNVPSTLTPEETRWYYRNRPHQLMPDLLDLLSGVEADLDQGNVTMPSSVEMKIWYAERETTIDPIGVEKMQEKIVLDRPVEATSVDTERHVFYLQRHRPRTEEETGGEDVRVWDDFDQELFEWARADIIDWVVPKASGSVGDE